MGIAITLVFVVGALATPQKAADVKAPKEEPKAAETPAQVPEAPTKTPVAPSAPTKAVDEKPVDQKPAVPEKPVVDEEPVVAGKPVVAEEAVVAEKPAINSADREMCSVKSASHLECLKNANFDPSELMKCGQTILSCLSDRWNVEKWW